MSYFCFWFWSPVLASFLVGFEYMLRWVVKGTYARISFYLTVLRPEYADIQRGPRGRFWKVKAIEARFFHVFYLPKVDSMLNHVCSGSPFLLAALGGKKLVTVFCKRKRVTLEFSSRLFIDLLFVIQTSIQINHPGQQPLTKSTMFHLYPPSNARKFKHT